jgi:hypothetical protein
MTFAYSSTPLLIHLMVRNVEYLPHYSFFTFIGYKGHLFRRVIIKVISGLRRGPDGELIH